MAELAYRPRIAGMLAQRMLMQSGVLASSTYTPFAILDNMVTLSLSSGVIFVNGPSVSEDEEDGRIALERLNEPGGIPLSEIEKKYGL